VSDDVPAEPLPEQVTEALRMRASDADREKVAAILRDAYVEGRLTPLEHEERLAEVYRATTYGQLAPILRDLPVPPGTLAVPTSHGVQVTPPVMRSDTGLGVRPDLATQGDGSLVAIFSGFERKGAWVVPPEVNATCIFGGGEIDLTEAVLTSGETVFRVTAIFGGLQITVPAGVAIRNESIGIFGGIQVPADSAVEGAPLIVIKGAAVFGGIDVRRPKPPKTRRISGA
jgi:Domain of unknown function (DUF1707)/Cell wall-active antibiotics response 4TMS YvqF